MHTTKHMYRKSDFLYMLMLIFQPELPRILPRFTDASRYGNSCCLP